jgi:hypothetical protein
MRETAPEGWKQELPVSAKFIKLTLYGGGPEIYLNPQYIGAISHDSEKTYTYEHGSRSVVALGQGEVTYSTVETPEQILALIASPDKPPSGETP